MGILENNFLHFMLINLSNHPLSTWSQKQIAEAENFYGRIIDVDFPQIPPDADEEIVSILAKDFTDICLDILSSSKDKNNAVHIMGEMTFSFLLILQLHNNNVECVASTTKRNSKERDGEKISRFEFVRFRKYSRTDFSLS